MNIGVPKEIKDNENRVGMIPAGVRQLVADGHTVKIEAGAGEGSGIPDTAYADAGADIVSTDAAWDADMVVKIKEPLESEYPYLTADKIVFTYFHLAADRDLTEQVLESGITAIAYETVEENGELPLLRPMSQVAGRMAPIMGSYYLTRHNDGRGTLLPGIPGVSPGNVLILGGGTVGENAARMAAGLGADVTILEIDQGRMAELADVLPANVSTRISNRHNLEEELPDTDVLVGAVLVPGGKAPELVTEDDLDRMPDGAVIVDVAVDQGGCVETTRPTSHSNPVYEEHGVIHYAVTNMPGAYARTATFGITNATMPYVRAIANTGWKQAMQDDPALLKGLNAHAGDLTYRRVADDFSMDWTNPEQLITE
jgi:alanine dehydrogenase